MLPNRQSIRKRGWDYASAGWYFVTTNTHRAKAWFGVLANGKMLLNEVGKIAEEEWHKSAEIRQGLVLDEFVVMPDHVHGLVKLAGATCRSPVLAGRPFMRPCGPAAGSLGALMAGYKAAVSRQARQRGLINEAAKMWHRNYWDVIVFDDRALRNIRRYIRMNPQHALVVGEPRFEGNQALWERSRVGFLASRGSASPHGRLPMNEGEVVLSSFLSPMERSVFRAMIKAGRPLIWVKPWGLREGMDDPVVRKAIKDGLILVVSPFGDDAQAPSQRRAAWSNQFVLANSQRVVVGHLNPSGMLACILSEANPDVEMLFL